MTDITDLMNAYRECSRHVWNAYFLRRENIGSALDGFWGVNQRLFESLVVDQLSYEGEAEHPNLPPPALRVVPRERSPILIKDLNAPGQASFWGVVKDLFVGPEDITLAFVDYFDWSNLKERDFRFYRCKILSFPSMTEFEGREALIEAMDGRVYHDEQSDDLDSGVQRPQ